LTGWQSISGSESGPAMFRATLSITEEPTDTFLDMSSWGKGCIFVNGFSLGRYFNLGPQITNFIPAPLLTQGDNEVFKIYFHLFIYLLCILIDYFILQIVVFEHYSPASQLVFTDTPNLGQPKE
jgi:hypothetical protein